MGALVYRCTLQSNPLIIQELCKVIADEDSEVASKSSNVLELVINRLDPFLDNLYRTYLALCFVQFSRFQEGEFFKPVLDLLKTKSQSRSVLQYANEQKMRCPDSLPLDIAKPLRTQSSSCAISRPSLEFVNKVMRECNMPSRSVPSSSCVFSLAR